MSVVTTVILTMSTSERIAHDSDVIPALDAINAWLTQQRADVPLLKPLDADKTPSAGTKYPQAIVAWGGFNYLNEREVINAFVDAPWVVPDKVVLVMYSDTTHEPKLYRIGNIPNARWAPIPA